MPDPAHNTQLNKELRLHMAALLYFLSRLAITVFVFAVPALYFTMGVVELPFVIGGAVLVVALFLGYYAAAAPLRCAACSSPVLMDNGNRKHPSASRLPGLNHRARVAWDILFASSYQCMYCITRCRCKKSWGGKGKVSTRTSSYQAPIRTGDQNSFPGSIFGDVGEPVSDGEPPFVSPVTAQDAGAAGAPSERVVSGAFSAASIFPNARTVPVSLVTPATAPSPPAAGAGPFAAAQPSTVPVQQEVIIDTPASAPLFPGSRPLPAAPVPWSIPVPDSPTLAMESPMNQQTFPDPNAAVPANPFLAAAASMPPPPTPMLPTMPPAKPRVQPETASPAFHSEFPYAPSAEPMDGPPPWTIPSMAAENPAPVAAPFAPVSAPAPAPVSSQAQMIKDVVSVLEEGQRSLAGAFQSMIAKLGSQLNALAQVPVSAPAPVMAPPPVAAPQMPAPVAPQPVITDAPVAVAPAAVVAPAPVLAPPVAPAPVLAPPVVSLPPVPAPVPVTVAPPAPPVQIAASLPELPDLLAMRPPPHAATQMRAPQGKTTLVSVPVLPPVPPAPVKTAATPFSQPPPAAVPAASPYAHQNHQGPNPFGPPQPVAPVAPVAPVEMALPHGLQAPVPFAVPVPPAPAPAAPVSASVPAPATAPVADTAPRRRFARPSTVASQELNQMLQDVFAPTPAPTPAPASAPAPLPAPATPASAPVPPPAALPPIPDWHQGNVFSVPAPVPAPAAAHMGNGHYAPREEAAPVMPAAPRQTAPEQLPPHPASPFGISETPLYAPPGAPQEPAPFTFLTNDGGHFTPPPPAPGDPLDDSIMPWMKPVLPGHTRN